MDARCSLVFMGCKQSRGCLTVCGELFAVCDYDGARSQGPEGLIDRRRVDASRAPRRSDLLAITSTPSPFPLLLAGCFSNALGGVGTSASLTPVEDGRVAGTNRRAVTHIPLC